MKRRELTSMKISTFFYTIKQGFANLFRNKWYTLASIATMAACLLMLGVFYSVAANFRHIVKNVEEVVSFTVFFEEGISQERIDEIGDMIRGREEVASKTKADALRHPNWMMGAKITIDCATLMNKCLEFIEAMSLFAVTPEDVSVVIHRQSIIHSMVEFRDGSVIAQMGTPDMRLPIRYALTYPERVHSPLPPLDLLSCPPLTFHEPDLEVFPSLRMAMECAKIGGTSCAGVRLCPEIR